MRPNKIITKTSVVIPLYNKEGFIDRCLNSVINQTQLPFEIIIVDDGSTDNSNSIVREIIEDQKEVNIKLIVQENSGVSAARNLGIKCSAGDFVALLDADDLWDKCFLYKMSELIKNFPDASMYSCFHKVMDSKGNFFKPKNILPNDFLGYIDDYHHLASSNMELINSSKVILRKSSFFSIGGFPEGAVITEDLYLWFLMALNFKCAYLNDSLVQINQFPDASRANRANKMLYIIKFYVDNFNDYKKLSKSQKKYLYSINLRHVLGSLSDGNLKEAYNRLLLANKLFRVRNLPLFLLLLIPYPIFTKVKKLRRSFLTRKMK